MHDATHRSTWSALKASRPDTPERRAGYDRARMAFMIGVRVRELREAKGMSQDALARHMGTTQSAIARLEAGGAEPRFDTLERIAQALGAELIFDLRPLPYAST